jgi:SAM-dependent methyltransferase
MRTGENFETLQKHRFEKRPPRDVFFYEWRLKTSYVFDKFKKIYDGYIPQGTRKVLELGCGDGVVGHYFKDRPESFTYVGIDRALQRLEFAKGELPRWNFCGADVRKLPFADGVFDAVICNGVFHHLEPDDFKSVFEEMVRIVRPGGILFFQEPNGKNFFYRLLGFLSKSERGILDLKEENCRKVIESIPDCRGLEFFYKEAFMPFDFLTQFFFWSKFVRGRQFAGILWKIEEMIEKISKKDGASVLVGRVFKSQNVL